MKWRSTPATPADGNTDSGANPGSDSDAVHTATGNSVADQARARAAAARRAAEDAEREAEAAEARERANAARAAADLAEREAAEAETAEAPEAPEAPEPTAAEAEAEAQPRRRRSRRAVVGVAASLVVIVGLLGLCGFFVVQHQDARATTDANVAFTQAARQGVVNMTTLDFENAQNDVQRVIDSSTGEFRDDFQGRAESFIQVVQESKVVTEGTVSEAGVESTDGDTAVVLVAATSKVTNAAGAEEEPRSWRLRVTVAPDGDQLKMSKVEFVP